jgi:hypothetical protein
MACGLYYVNFILFIKVDKEQFDFSAFDRFFVFISLENDGLKKRKIVIGVINNDRIWNNNLNDAIEEATE